MGAIGKIVRCSLPGLIAVAMSHGAAAATASEQPARMFADCAGRLSALMEHQWLTGGPAADTTRAQRDALLQLLDAVLAPADARAALNWRVTAKAAHAALLMQARFGPDPAAALRAMRRADDLARACTAMLLGQS